MADLTNLPKNRLKVPLKIWIQGDIDQGLEGGRFFNPAEKINQIINIAVEIRIGCDLTQGTKNEKFRRLDCICPNERAEVM